MYLAYVILFLLNLVTICQRENELTIINLEKILKQHATRYFIIFKYLVSAPFF